MYFFIRENSIHFDDVSHLLSYLKEKFEWYFHRIYADAINSANVIECCAEASKHGYSSINMPIRRENFKFDIYHYYLSYLLRGDEPDLYRNGYLSGNILGSNGYKVCYAKSEMQEARANFEASYLYYLYHYSESVNQKGLESVHEKLPEYFVSSAEVPPMKHLEIQAALQTYVDSSISKTINIPTDYPYEDFKNIYLTAYEKGLKGCTTFRPSEHITGVLIREEDKKKDEKKEEKKELEHPIIIRPQPPKRPLELEGTTYKIRTPLAADALYVTINDLVEEDGRRRPYEIFINTKNLQYFSWIVAMTRLISSVFRHDPAPKFLVEELKSIYDPNGGYFSDGTYIPSLAADIGRIIEKHLAKIGIMASPQKRKSGQKHSNSVDTSNDSTQSETHTPQGASRCPGRYQKEQVVHHSIEQKQHINVYDHLPAPSK
jgi:hypothetical protein